MKIKTRLLGGFLFISLLAALTGYWGLLQLKEIAKPLNKDIPLSIEQLDRASTLDKLARYIQYLDEVLTQSVRNYALTQDIRWKQRYYAFKPELDQAIQQALDKSTDANGGLFKHVKPVKTALVEMENTAIGLLNSNNHSEAIDLLESERYGREKRNFEGRLQDYFLKHGIIEKQEITVKLAAQHTQEILRDSIAITLLFVTAIIALSIIVGLIITQSIARPLRQLIRHTEKMSHGDLSQQIDIVSNDEIGNLASSFNQMTAKLQKTMVSKDYVDNIIRSMTDSLIIVSPDGNIETVNAATSALLGYEEKELIGQPVNYIFAEEAFRDAKIAELIKKEAVTNINANYCTKDGKEVPMLLSGAAMKDPAANLKAIVIVARDMRDSKLIAELQAITEQLCEEIAERKQTEEKLSQAQKLKAVGQLAAGIAHEINTPTQYIASNIDFLGDAFEDISSLMAQYHILLESAKQGSISQDHAEAADNALEEADWEYLKEEVPAAVSQAKEGTQRVTTIVRAMKEFSHPSSKEKVPSDLVRIITNTTTVCQNEWKNIADLETDFAPDLPSVPCIADEIGQVILNIMVNAAHAISDKLGDNSEGKKGTIKITARTNGENAEILIQDSGSGIPEDLQKQIFDPFFTTKEVGQGSGQGLAIAHDVIANKHGGELTFETEMDKGTTFIIRLPIKA